MNDELVVETDVKVIDRWNGFFGFRAPPTRLAAIDDFKGEGALDILSGEVTFLITRIRKLKIPRDKKADEKREQKDKRDTPQVIALVKLMNNVPDPGPFQFQPD